MSASSKDNVGAALLRIHSVITRGLRVTIERSQSFADQGYPSASMREGFISYVRSLLSVLDAHHTIEDQLAFPRFKDSFPDAPYDLLMTQHQSLLPILNQLTTTIEEKAADAEQSVLLNKQFLLLKSLDEIWHPHIRIEEDYFSVDKLGAAFPADEHIRLNKLFLEHSQQHAKPDFLVVPFLLYNLPPEQRSEFAEEMPPIVTEQLVPVVWKEKWEPMRPFLLLDGQ